jgi:hypothetical protein
MSGGQPTKTIAQARAAGETSLTVHCTAPGCDHQAVKTFEKLRLWNNMIFVGVLKHRRLVCSKCGSRNAKVMLSFRRDARRGMTGSEGEKGRVDAEGEEPTRLSQAHFEMLDGTPYFARR